MINPDQKNIKIHLAGGESDVRAVLFDHIGIKYSLFTIFPFIADKLNITHGFQGSTDYATTVRLNKNKRHVIQDSGIYSLIFGTYKNKDPKFIYAWLEHLIEMTIENNYTGTLVEVDAQNILGSDETWMLRYDLHKRVKNKIINVFHPIDKQKGLDRLIEFSDYIAFSLSELRAVGLKNHAIKLAGYIKNKKPSIDIHLLGCTDNKLLKALSYCTSSDSTSWNTLNKYGQFKFNDGDKTHSHRKNNINLDKARELYESKVVETLESLNINVTRSRIDYYICDVIQMEYAIKQYSVYAGDQS